MPRAAKSQSQSQPAPSDAEIFGAFMGSAKGPASGALPSPPPALTRLAEALEADRDLIIQPDRQQDRAARAHLAAMQYESFQKVQTDLTGAMLRGQLDPAAHREACNSIEQVTKRLFLLAERMDKVWAPVTTSNIKADVQVRSQIIDSSVLSADQRHALRGALRAAIEQSKVVAVQGSGDGEEGETDA